MRNAALLFAASLLLRAAHWLLSPERFDAFTADYQGDAPYWQQICAGNAGLEALLPFRPPGMQWLATMLWDGNGSAFVARLAMTLLGSLIAPALWLSLRSSLDPKVALLAAWICACSHSLLVLGSGLHVEVPYLLLATIAIGDFELMRKGPAPFASLRWGALSAAACLFRAEHLLFVFAALAWLGWKKRSACAKNVAAALATFVLALLPWQLHVANTIADFNDGRQGGTQRLPPIPPPGSLPWDSDAIDAVRAMPAFTQLPTAGFVADSVRTRGGARVTRDDLRIVAEAYGCQPERLHTPLLALYGPLNFFLANSNESSAEDGGFTRAALDRKPPFEGGLARYPNGILNVLPQELSLGYPPHLDAVNHGYAKGLAWIASHPSDALSLLASKLMHAWRGAASGIGIHSFPIGRDGTRMPVDAVTSDSLLATVWRALLFALAAIGARGLRRDEGATQTFLVIATRFLLAIPFFGYARLGALAIPALAVLWAAALQKPFAAAQSFARTRSAVASAAIALLCVADLATAYRSTRPTVTGSNSVHVRKFVSH